MFSELIDSAIQRSGRGERINDIVAYANQTVRECQSAHFFFRDLTEDQITGPTSSPVIWNIPQYFRKMRTVKYESLGYEPIYPDYRAPGQNQQTQSPAGNFYYAAGSYFVFSGVVVNSASSSSIQVTQNINIAYYSWLPRLKYYASGSRPAIYDEPSNTWTYLQNGAYVSDLGDIDANSTAQNQVTNWLILTYWDVILEGTLAKLFKTVNDQRAISTFALFKQLAAIIEQNETFETLER